MYMNQNCHVNKTNFHMKGFVLGLALKQRQKKKTLGNRLLSWIKGTFLGAYSGIKIPGMIKKSLPFE